MDIKHEIKTADYIRNGYTHELCTTIDTVKPYAGKVEGCLMQGMSDKDADYQQSHHIRHVSKLMKDAERELVEYYDDFNGEG